MEKSYKKVSWSARESLRANISILNVTVGIKLYCPNLQIGFVKIKWDFTPDFG